ncbi:hypothetical protein SAMD00019534_024490 [Acytostelium subglobosum LB1]|uniref:hypothetical protein n=1 Tax=Acytostelium subglobosum LB1 TaxID=1410327 RepID=UPI0006452092|nr:hypothetical protein SAMD00019534_024490 [Acytostelium subglobosum LB1]GAM19274.1 hypothetical protein SAMD00019534_024490 [Acytostelium subglobosum LB1]|eukprot:XP_012757201.1 hypothetical protein SAMD00019534_024490 [Acytostelium subglobosum LB1]
MEPVSNEEYERILLEISGQDSFVGAALLNQSQSVTVGTFKEINPTFDQIQAVLSASKDATVALGTCKIIITSVNDNGHVFASSVDNLRHFVFGKTTRSLLGAECTQLGNGTEDATRVMETAVGAINEFLE